MIRWLKKFRISAALDAAQPKSETNQANSPALREFEETMKDLETRLREARPAAAEIPPGLHHSIMRSLRSNTGAVRARLVPIWLRWAAAPALAAAMVLLALLFAGPQPSPAPAASEALNSAVSTVQRGGELARAVPSAVLAPLSHEWTSISNDVQDTASFLIASLP